MRRAGAVGSDALAGPARRAMAGDIFLGGRRGGAVPELPEVETIRRGLAHRVGRTIVRADVRRETLRRPSPQPLARLAQRRVQDVRRQAKVMFWDLDDGSTFAVHLGMTGRVLLADGPERPHTHLVLFFDDGVEVRFEDARRFGHLRLHPPGQTPDDTAGYGVDALDPAFTAARLQGLLASSRAPLKGFLLDQSRVAGLGNIYACEALWRAGLSPRRRACNTPRHKVARLHDAIGQVLRASIDQGGTSFNDYVDQLGRPGKFVADLAVFQREGLPCPSCRAPVRRFVQSGRSTFYCPCCQR